MTTIRWPWIAVAVLCCLLALATSASAECALGNDGRFDPSPEALRPALAFDSPAECAQGLIGLFKGLPDEKRAVWQTASVCLPDSVDPRGPKGK